MHTLFVTCSGCRTGHCLSLCLPQVTLLSSVLVAGHTASLSRASLAAGHLQLLGFRVDLGRRRRRLGHILRLLVAECLQGAHNSARLTSLLSGLYCVHYCKPYDSAN